jgi:hypothetical protein
MSPAQILGDARTDGLDMGELMQYRSAGIMAMGLDVRAITNEKTLSAEIENILGNGIA